MAQQYLIRIAAPSVGRFNGFVAAVVVRSNVVIRTAPIVNYMRGWHHARVVRYCMFRGWECATPLAATNTLDVAQT